MSQYIENGNISSQAGTRAERVPWRNFAGQLDLRHWNCLWLLLYLAGIAVYLFSFPKFLDDFWFLDKFSDYLSQQGIVLDNKSPDLIANGIPFSEIWETWEWRYLNDNARLSNILVVLLLLTPTWFCHLLSFLCWTYCIIGGLTLAKVDWRRSYLVAPALLAWMFIVPGIDEIASITFQLNYIVPCALGLYILKKIIEPPGTGATQVMVVFLSFLLGWWHEGFSIPFLGGLFGLATVSRSFRKPFYLAIAIALAAGLAIVVTAPAIWQRMGTDYAVVNIGRVLKLSMYFVYLCILVCLIAFCCIRRKSFKPLANPPILFIVVSSVLSALIQLKVNSTPRAMWWGLYSPVIGILYLLNKRAENGPSLKSAGKWMCRLLIIPVLAFLTVVDCYAIQLRQDWNRCVETYISQPERSIFGRSITPDVARLFMINLPPIYSIPQTFCSLTKELSRLRKNLS